LKTITAINRQKKNRRRYSLFLDGTYAFSISERVANTLHVGDLLTDERISALKAEDEKDLAFEKALSYLAPRPRSRKEIGDYLNAQGFTHEAIQHAVLRLEKSGYINDHEFARAWVDSRIRFHPRGIFALRYELSAKGVAEEIIDSVLENLDETSLAMRALESRISKWKGLKPLKMREKIFGYLKRRGFSYETARQVAQKAAKDMTP